MNINHKQQLLVLKFGGSSVGSAEGLQHVKHIVEAQTTKSRVIVVVSALGGVTDSLLQIMQLAAHGDPSYVSALNAIIERHHQMVADLVPIEKQALLINQLNALFAELQSILHGVCLIQDLTPKISDAIVSYGERLSSVIVADVIEGAVHFDSRKIIKTERQSTKHLVDFELTNKLIKDALSNVTQPIVMGGFIASDKATGVSTNLGRGGSDYTASIIAAALNATALEIWTDVDGFMTADPKIIPNAFTIDQLSYAEAMELCNFGAKVVYPPTIYPVCKKNIPIYVKNTFCPTHRGTVIRQEVTQSERPIRGISSVKQTSTVTVSGASMVGVIGVNRRIFTTLAAAGISVFMVAQNSSETSTTLCLTPDDARKACQLLDKEFAVEIVDGSMNPAILADGLSSVAVVGQRMRHMPGIAGQLFSVLGRNGISINATAMGGQEINLSFVVDRKQLRKTINVLHDSFFLSEHEDLNLFICGTGTVGGSLLEQLATQHDKLFRERGLNIRVVGISGRSHAIYDADGIDLSNYKQLMKQSMVEGGVEHMMREIEEMNIFNSVFVDCTASAEVASFYDRLLSHNVNIVAANKIAASSDYDNYLHLKHIAREKGVKYLFETNVGAGLPIINTINDLRGSGDKVLRIEAVLSGTLNYVFNTLSADISLSKAVKMAQENGYSEPDPRIDLSGKDVIRKLVILARESGYKLNVEDVECNLFIPKELFDGSLDNFWAQLPSLDARFEQERKRLEQTGKRWRFVAEWADGKASVGLREIPQGHPLYDLEGSNNILLLTTERYRDYPMLIQGYGAGAAVTAAGVFADIMRVANV